MQKRISFLFVLLVTVLLLTACGSKEKKNATETDTLEYLQSKFTFPAEVNANSHLEWKANEDNSTIGTLTIELVAPNPAALDKKFLLQYLTSSSIAVNKEGKVSIERLIIQVKDNNQNSLFDVSCFGSGQSYTCNGVDLEEIKPSQTATQDTNHPYPIQPVVPVIAPTPYP